ncbi:MAG: glycosyltransferase family 39 protein [Caldilineaceae bacterium]|nr:glycosyltransferase family 39 protein [Caldilineaceae bacterium]
MRPTADSPGNDRPAARWLDATILLALIAVTAATNLYWLRENVVMVGHDATAYLVASLSYTEFFNRLSPAVIFQGLTYPEYRTPFLYLATQPFFWLFGADADSAQWTNVVTLPVVIVLTYALGRVMAGRRAGLVAATITALLPMMTAMARLYYTEMHLTAVVTASLLALLLADSFRRRGWALAWGALAGLGLLVKWTYPMYLALPLLWVLWRGGFFGAQWAALRRFRIDWRRLALAAVIGSGLALLWYWPNRELAAELPAGVWMLPAWALLWSLTAYAILRPASIVGTVWAALLLGASIASLWYVPRSDFVQQLLVIDQVRAPEGASPQSLSNYTRYFGFFYDEHLGPLAFWAIVPLALAPWLLSWWRRLTLNRPATLLWLSIVSAYVVLSLILQHNARNLVPVLPALAILAAIALLTYRRPFPLLIGVLWLAILAGQWALTTFQPLAPVLAQSQPLWVESDYVVPPASGSTDPGYWIEPAVLDAVMAESSGAAGEEADSLGILVETWEVHRGLFRYLAERDKLNLTIMALTEPDSRGWSDALANRWLLVKDGDNGHVAAPGQAVIDRIAAGDALFHALYAPAATYPLPDGDTITLYRRDGPRQPQAYPVITIETTPVADALNQWAGADATLVFGDRDTALWTGIHDIHGGDVRLPDLPGGDIDALRALTGTIFLVTRYERGVLDAFGDAYPARDLVSGDTTLSVYGRPVTPLESLPVASPWDAVAVEELRTLPAIRAGDVLPVEMALTPADATPLALSVRLLAADGTVVAQHDAPVAERARLGLLAPATLPPGAYTVGAVLYDPATFAVIPDRNGNELGVLGSVTVEPAPE